MIDFTTLVVLFYFIGLKSIFDKCIDTTIVVVFLIF